MRKRLTESGSEPVASTPQAFGELIARETKSWAALVKSTGTKID